MCSSDLVVPPATAAARLPRRPPLLMPGLGREKSWRERVRKEKGERWEMEREREKMYQWDPLLVLALWNKKLMRFFIYANEERQKLVAHCERP